MLSFIKNFEKTCDKLENVTSQSEPPRYWYNTGNYVLNYISSGNFSNGIPQGRVTGLAGPSGSGKTFIQCNVATNAQKDGSYVLMIDSENALDDDFTSKVGVTVDDPSIYNYKSVVTMADVVKMLSAFISGYKKAYDDAHDAPKVLIVIDSLDMLLTDTELNNFEKGENKGDQGQRAKQMKAMLRTLVQQIKNLNIAIVVTCQVYAATQENILKGAADGVWVINGAVKYSLSHVLLLTKLKLKSDSEITGIKMKCYAAKTRFTKPFQDVVIEVPYETGMNPYSGLIEVCENLGIVEKKGSYKRIVGSDSQFYAKDVAEYADELFERINSLDNVQMKISDGYQEEGAETQEEFNQRRGDLSRLEQAVKNKSETND